MSAVAHVEITGLAEIRAKLTPEAFRATLRAALRDALRPVARQASALAPVRTGTLQHKIHAVISDRGGNLRAAIVGGTGYGHLVEYGHRMVTGGRIGRGFVPLSRRVRLTGTVSGVVPPHPFAQPAWAAGQDSVARLIEERLQAAIAS